MSDSQPKATYFELVTKITKSADDKIVNDPLQVSKLLELSQLSY